MQEMVQAGSGAGLGFNFSLLIVRLLVVKLQLINPLPANHGSLLGKFTNQEQAIERRKIDG